MTPESLKAMQASPAEFRRRLFIPSAHAGAQRFVDVIAPFQAERFASLEPALLAVASGRKPPIGRHWWEATKGASKDTDLSIALLWLLAFSNRALQMQVGAADADQAAELRKAARSILLLQENAWLRSFVDLQSYALLNPHTGSRCEIISSDSASSHGARPDVLVLNELTHLPDGKRDFAETLLDNASKVPNGIVVVATNSGFLGSWQEPWRDLARTSPRWFFHAYSQPAPWLDDGELAKAKARNSPERYARLWQGTWTGNESSALLPADIQAATVLPGPMPCRLDGYEFVVGVDLSTRRDRSAAVCLAGDLSTRKILVADVATWNPKHTGGQIDFAEIERHIVELHRKFNIAGVVADQWQAEMLLQNLSRRGIYSVGVHYTAEYLDRMTRTTMQVFQDGFIQLWPHRELLDDLGRLKVVERPDGRQRLVAKRSASTGHADIAFALATVMPEAVNMIDPDSFFNNPPDRHSDNCGGFNVIRV